MSVTRFIGLLFKGAAMGAANVIPGVSGGTIALITGIYPDLIDTLKSVGWKAVKLFAAGNFREWFHHLNGSFACSVGLGVVASVFIFANVLEQLLANHETLMIAFFYGLILASVVLVGRQVPKWNPLTILALLVGIAGAATILLVKPLVQNSAPAYLVLCGVVAMCSMILPGISGSFILILMGNYALILKATSNVRDFDSSLPILLPFAAGCAVGLFGFARVLSYILEKFKAATLAVLTGFVIGSLGVIWPWKITLEKMVGEKIVVTGYTWQLPAVDKPFALAMLLMLAGVGLVLLLDKIAGTKRSKKDTNK